MHTALPASLPVDHDIAAYPLGSFCSLSARGLWQTGDAPRFSGECFFSFSLAFSDDGDGGRTICTAADLGGGSIVGLGRCRRRWKQRKKRRGVINQNSRSEFTRHSICKEHAYNNYISNASTSTRCTDGYTLSYAAFSPCSAQCALPNVAATTNGNTNVASAYTFFSR